MISTRNPDALPSPRRVRDLCKSLALLDFIVIDREESRNFHYMPRWWHVYRGLDLGWLLDHMGDWCYLFFTPAGIVLRGRVLHCPLGCEDGLLLEPDLFADVPEPLQIARTEEWFGRDLLTFVIWRAAGDKRWRAGRLPEVWQRRWEQAPESDLDGSEEILWILDDDPATYVDWIDDRLVVDADLVAMVYRHETITEELILKINPDARGRIDEVLMEAEAMGFTISRNKMSRPEDGANERRRCFRCMRQNRDDCPYEQPGGSD